MRRDKNLLVPFKNVKNKEKILNLKERKSKQHKKQQEKLCNMDTTQWSNIFNINPNIPLPT